ncbi:MAG: MOSC domain-containing protein, partial [Geminicoccaceae bacterium]
VDPVRFRANLYIAGLPAWAELDWVGGGLAAGDVRFEVTKRIDRCAATNVDPATGIRDLNVPQALRQHYGHIDCGLLLRVTRGGRIAIGQSIELRDGAAPAECGQTS